MFEWIQTNPTASWWIASVSLAILVAALIMAPWVVTRIPFDYFSRRRRDAPSHFRRHAPVAWWGVTILKNVAGVVLVLAGMALLVLPGQGLLTILIGFALMNFPGKFRIERWIVSRGPTLKVINHIRHRRGRPALVLQNDPNLSDVPKP